MTASLDPGADPDRPSSPDTGGLPRSGLPERLAPDRGRLLRESLFDRLPPVLRRGTLDPAVRGAFGLAAVALIAAIVAGCYAWQARPVAVAVPPAAGPAVPAPEASPTGRPAGGPIDLAGRAGPTTSAGPPAEVVVHVAGKVRRPGVVAVAASARVNDAVLAAGGALPGTDLASVDLARRVVDGEQILVGVPGTPAPMSAAPAGGPGETGSPVTQGSGGAQPAEALDLNSAGPEQLDGLPGVGPVLAQRIIGWRTEHGGFRSVEELREVKGLGGKKFDDIAPLVRV